MRLDRRTFVKGAGVAAGAALTPGTAAGLIDDGIDTDGGLQEVIVVFEDNDDVDVLERFDLADGYYRFQVLPFGYTRATGDQIERIAALDSVRYVEKNRELEYHNDDARELTGAAAAQEDLVETGAGAHTVVIDSGVDGYHPDLQPNLRNNFRYVNPLSDAEDTMWVDVGAGDSDDIGHGTHCSGSVAGIGQQSDGQYAGMAPDADLTVYSAGLTVYILKIAGAVDDMIARKRNGELDVQVVSNSYGLDNDHDFNPVSASNLAMWEAFASGILPVFSASNSGPDHGTLNYAAKAPYVLGVAATFDGDFGPAKRPTDFSSRGRPPADERGAGYAADYETAYDDNEGAHYDRRRALRNVRRFHRSGQGDVAEVDADYETSISGTVSYGVDPAYEDPIQDPNYFEWQSPPGAGYLEATVTWQPQGQAIQVKVHRDSEEGTVIATGSELVNDGEFTFDAPIDGDRTYVFEVVGEYNVQSQFTMELTALETEPSAPEGPFGIYRVGVGAPGNAVMSTETHTDVLKYTGPTYGGDDGTDPWYGSLSGTSMSCPVTSGICTLVNAAYRREAGHFPKPIDVLNIVEATAEGGTGEELAGHTEANMGAGFVDAAAAVERARELGRRAGSRGDDETKSDHPQLWNAVDLCDHGRGVAVPDVQGNRADDGSVFTAGQVNHVEFTLTDATHRLSRVRDAIPASWEVVAGDHAEVVEVFDAKYVYFDVDYHGEGETTFGYIVEAPSETGQYGFGPAEAIAEDGESFVPIPDTEDTNAVVGQEQPDL
ncbi:S8 family serine peptidase [Natronomonas salina]|uniref:S8 family peptidase n=1 Tax=Natronomonas salina TaxID=1710540 RepID=UPI0015B4E53A|nr:S8 family serine peptidase [Natronomonas salina]QLD90274.1 S8 family serine peptidase [Natronomonas salina]